MIDWTRIAGGRCSHTAWNVGIAGYCPVTGQLFLLSNSRWQSLLIELPLQQLQAYGDANLLSFRRFELAQTTDTDALLLLGVSWEDDALLDPDAVPRRYLLLSAGDQMPAQEQAKAFEKILIPADVEPQDRRLVHLNPPAMDSEQELAANSNPALNYPRSIDCWINKVTAAIAADASTLR